MEIPDFNTIPVSTRTIIAITNVILDLDKLYDFLPITPYTIIKKKRGRKKKIEEEIPVNNISKGSIITIDYKNQLKGVRVKPKKKSQSSSRASSYFRNSLTIVMMISNKLINFKITRNGKFQITGCKTEENAEECIELMWNIIKDQKEIYQLEKTKESTENKLTCIFLHVMRNIDFSVGFNIDREALHTYFNTTTDFSSLLETSIGYTGVNIKIPFKRPITEHRLKVLDYCDEKNRWDNCRFITFGDYISRLPPKEIQKKISKNRFHTFLIFHSGKIIMSSLCTEFAKECYYDFMKIIKENREQFIEKLDVSEEESESSENENEIE